MKKNDRNVIFGNNLKKAREKNKLTQLELGKLVGVSKNAIYNWEASIRQPNQDYIEKIAQALGVSFNRLFMTDEEYKEDIARLKLLYGDDEEYKVVHIEMPITYENIIKSLKELSLDELQALTGAIDLMLSMKKQEDI